MIGSACSAFIIPIVTAKVDEIQNSRCRSHVSPETDIRVIRKISRISGFKPNKAQNETTSFYIFMTVYVGMNISIEVRSRRILYLALIFMKTLSLLFICGWSLFSEEKVSNFKCVNNQKTSIMCDNMFSVALPCFISLYSLTARSMGNKKRRAYRSIPASVSRRNCHVRLIEWPIGRRVFDRRKGCCGNRGGVRHTGNCPTGNPINGRARLLAAPRRVASALHIGLAVGAGLYGSVSGVNVFRSAALEGEPRSDIPHNYPSIRRWLPSKTIRKRASFRRIPLFSPAVSYQTDRAHPAIPTSLGC